MSIQTSSRTFQQLTHVLCVLSMELNTLITEVGVVHREYIIAKGRRWEEREAFRVQSRRHRSSRPVTYPPELRDLPCFADWLKARVLQAEAAGDRLDEDVEQYSCPPERFATSHRQMNAFGMHLRVQTAEGGLVTRDSCVVATYTQQLRWGICNGRPIEHTAEHVGYIQEILELDYRNHCTTVLLCEWVRASPDVRVPSIERDKYGFSMANFNLMDNRVHPDSFAFPLHCQQVFFSDDPTRRGWKIICRTDVRGRRTTLHHRQPVANGIAIGDDANFQGLQPQILEIEPIQRTAPTGGSYVTAATNSDSDGEMQDE